MTLTQEEALNELAAIDSKACNAMFAVVAAQPVSDGVLNGLAKVNQDRFNTNKVILKQSSYDEATMLAVLGYIETIAVKRTEEAMTLGFVNDKTHDGIVAVNATRYKENIDLVNRFKSTPIPVDGPQAPDGFTLVFADDFDDLDTTIWKVWGAGYNETWGQAGGRVGFYSANAVNVTNSLLTLTMTLDPAGRKATNGKPGYLVGAIDNRGGTKPVFPKFGYYEVRARFDCATGVWPAPLWLRQTPKGANSGEIDTIEWFSDYPDNARQAIHLLKDGNGLTVNVAPSQLGIPHHYPVNDISGWHTYASKITQEGNHVRFTQYVDGVQKQTFSTLDLLNAGKPHDDWITGSSWTGWDVALQVQAGGGGGLIPFGAKGPWKTQIDWVAISVPK